MPRDGHAVEVHVGAEGRVTSQVGIAVLLALRLGIEHDVAVRIGAHVSLGKQATYRRERRSEVHIGKDHIAVVERAARDCRVASRKVV